MIDKNTILSKTQNGLTVFRYYIPFDFKLGRNFKNPFYQDTKASCNIYYDRHKQCFKIKDFGNPDYSGDCFAFVAQINNLDVQREFFQVLQIINKDLNLHLEEMQDVTNTTSQTQKNYK
nr:bifunctional DNA primase/helicase [Flavobacteriaceae bacterium]